jgi:hypothetical protein
LDKTQDGKVRAQRKRAGAENGRRRCGGGVTGGGKGARDKGVPGEVHGEIGEESKRWQVDGWKNWLCTRALNNNGWSACG